jgi:RNA polymerase sporulation-specific sigma factor
LLLDVIYNLIGEHYSFVGYITNDNAFPHPLSENEEKDLFEKFKLGDGVAKTELIMRNLRLVVHILKKFSLKENQDDIISIGSIGLIKAIESFDFTKGNRLASYAARCIENEILMYIRSTRRTKCEVYLEEPIGVDKNGNQVDLLDVLGTDINLVHDEVESKIFAIRVSELIESILTDREKIIIKFRYGLNGDPKTQYEIADLLGISRSYVSRIEKKVLKKLRKEMNTVRFNNSN